MSSIGAAGEWVQHAKGCAERLEEQTDRTLSDTELNKLHNCLLAATVPVEAERSGGGHEGTHAIWPSLEQYAPVLPKRE